MPLDKRLQLPASVFSYLLPDWDQSLCVEQAFGQASTTVQRLLGLKQSVDSLEHMNQEMAQETTTFMLNRPQPEAEGVMVVASADQKGVVLRRSADNPPPQAHRTKGDKASQKRMATVATVYPVERYRRTPAEVVAALFRDAPESSRERPKPQHKQVWAQSAAGGRARLGDRRGVRLDDRRTVFARPGQGQAAGVLVRRPGGVMGSALDWLPERAVDILDLLHVTPRLWQAAHVFEEEGSPPAEDVVRDRLLRVLQGKAAGVIRGLREMATKRGLAGAKQRTLGTVCAYREANVERMHYDEYLAAGYPIASGVVEELAVTW